jgi:hypothetical protein
MPTLQDSFPRIKSAPPFLRARSGAVVTTVTPQIKPNSYRQAAPRSTPVFTLPNEPEDAKLTGGTRSLDRRLLALNLTGSRSSDAS